MFPPGIVQTQSSHAIFQLGKEGIPFWIIIFSKITIDLQGISVGLQGCEREGERYAISRYLSFIAPNANAAAAAVKTE